MSGIWADNESKRTLDTQTGIEYRSRHHAGKAVASELGIDPNSKPSPWVLVIKNSPGRFLDVKTGKIIDQFGNLLST